MTLLLTVPEAAASADTIQFKLVLGGEISWLHDALGRNFPLIVIPPLPEPPLLASMDDQDYVERKRLQVGRLLEKIIKRKVLADHPDFIHFLSSDMAPTEIGKPHRGVLSFLRFNRIKPSERGFTAYKASPPVEGDDQETYYRHQIYILTQESYYGSIAEYQNQIIQLRESLGDGLAQMGDQVIETTQSKYRLGEGNQEKSREVQRGLDRGMQVFGLLMDELGFIFTRQGKEEIMKFGDVMIEYKNFMDSLKIVFNVRTQHLIEYAECVKHRNKKKERSEKVKSRLGPTSASPEVQSAIVEEQEVSLVNTTIEKKFVSYYFFHLCWCMCICARVFLCAFFFLVFCRQQIS
ncbi:hypothetical protein J3Q64DRAFT_1635804 [Phycomyces blakesleeanus]|uniref:PX domain-containing protein n=1 Tax=Phycomyces blakesleeanus TaxID=4837 RepID=A0ABR3B6M9_PHYBL